MFLAMMPKSEIKESWISHEDPFSSESFPDENPTWEILETNSDTDDLRRYWFKQNFSEAHSRRVLQSTFH
jgi:hypothetical protein